MEPNMSDKSFFVVVNSNPETKILHGLAAGSLVADFWGRVVLVVVEVEEAGVTVLLLVVLVAGTLIIFFFSLEGQAVT